MIRPNSISGLHVVLGLIPVLQIINGCAIFKDTIGVTSPSSDIFLRNGSTLKINCTLYPKNFPEYIPVETTARDIFFRKDDLEEIPSSSIKILDAYTAQLHIQSASEDDSGFYKCYIRIPSNVRQKNSPITTDYVCGTIAKIGFPPIVIKDEDFNCVSMNWQNLTCSWKQPKNHIATTYKLQYFFPQYRGRKSRNLNCPEYKTKNSCFFSLDVTKNRQVYKQSAEYYVFKLTGNNALGTSSKLYLLHHYAKVLPSQPSVFRTRSIGKHGVTLEWKSDIEKELFPPGLDYQLVYQSQWDDPEDWKIINVSKNYMELSNLTSHTKYKFKLRCKSRTAADVEEWWSSYAQIEVTTQNDVPRNAPKIVSGMFEDHWFERSRRTVVLYWQAVPKQQWNGDRFAYHIQYMPLSSANGFGQSFSNESYRVHTTRFFWKYTNLDARIAYKFVIHPVNEVGMDQSVYSSIIIHERSKLPRKPKNIVAKLLINGSYEVSWQHNHDTALGQIQHYTVFWCQRHSFHKCDKPLHWKQVPAEHTKTFVHPQNDELQNQLFQFSVSASIGNATSGMAWADCVVSANGGPGKVQEVRGSPISSTKLKMYWDVDCMQQSNTMKGYFVYQCKLSDRKSCSEPLKKIFSETKELILHNLEPYQYYKIMASSVTKNNEESEKSEEFIIRMPEGVPAEPPSPQVVYHTNTSFGLSWKRSLNTNGIVRYYKINYNGIIRYYKINNYNEHSLTAMSSLTAHITRNVAPYRKYNISVSACTAVGCSKPSAPTLIQTKIGVPGKMAEPRYEILNSTFVKVFWGFPIARNGPLSASQISIAWKNSFNETIESNKTYTPWKNESFVEIDCSKMAEEDGKDYFVRVRAANHKDDGYIFGPWSNEIKIKTCFETADEMALGFIIGVTFGGTIGLVLITLLSYSLTKWAKQKISEVNKVTIQLPRGLGYGVTTKQNIWSTEHSFHAPSLNNNNIYEKYLMDRKTAHDINPEELFKSRHGSGDSAYSSGSTRQQMSPKMHSNEENYDSEVIHHESIEEEKDTAPSGPEAIETEVPSVEEKPKNVAEELSKATEKQTKQKMLNDQTVGLVLVGTPNLAAYSKFGQSSSPTDIDLKNEAAKKLDRRVSDSEPSILTYVKSMCNERLEKIDSEPHVADVDSGHDSDSCNNDLSGSFLSSYARVGLSNSYTDLHDRVSAKTDIRKQSPDMAGTYSKFGLMSSIPFSEKLNLCTDPCPGYVTINQIQCAAKDGSNDTKRYCKENLSHFEFKSLERKNSSPMFLRETPVNRNAHRDSGVSISSPTMESTASFNGYVPNSIANNVVMSVPGKNPTGYVPVSEIPFMFPLDDVEAVNTPPPPKTLECSIDGKLPNDYHDRQIGTGYISYDKFLKSEDQRSLNVSV